MGGEASGVVYHGAMRWQLGCAVVLVGLLACGDDESSSSGNASSSSSGTSSSTSSGDCPDGVSGVEGFITLSSSGEAAPEALALVRKAPTDIPLQVKSDKDGYYSVFLDDGPWLIDGSKGDYCATSSSTQVVVGACEYTTANLQLDCFFGGGGAGGGGASGGAGGGGGAGSGGQGGTAGAGGS